MAVSSKRKFCVIDAEGDVGRLGLLGVAFWSEEIQEYVEDHDRIRELLDWHARRRYTFVAHNAQYDLPVIFWQLDIPMRAVYYNATFNRGEWKYHPKRAAAQLWDSLDLSGGISVAALGKAIDLKKYPTPQRLRGIDPNKYEWKCELHERWECEECYALRDCEIVYRYMQTYVETLDVYGVKPQRRMAGAAVSLWKVLDQQGPIRLENGAIRHLARQSYFGGRVEAFKLGHFRPLYSADVASMYPSVMKETPFPSPHDMVLVHAPHVDRYPFHLEGVAECVVRIPHMYVPPLPTARQGLRTFSTGLIRGVWTHVELRYAMSLGADILRIVKGAYSLTTVAPFLMFVGTLWELRNEYSKRNDPRKQTVKILLNSCYGRIGMRGDMLQEVIEPWDLTKDYTKYSGWELMEIDGKGFVRLPSKPPMQADFVNVLWASYITSAARVRLHQYITYQGSNIVYCDTDSVFSQAPIVGIGDGLGALVEPTAYTSGWIVGPKLYRLEYEKACVPCPHCMGEHTCRECNSTGMLDHLDKAKGVPRRLAEQFLRGEEVVFDSPIKPRAMARRGTMAGTWVQIHRERQLVPSRRTPVNPSALDSEFGWSDTVPPVSLPSGL